MTFVEENINAPRERADGTNARVAAVVANILGVRSINRNVLADDDLREVGLTSLDMVKLMLAVEAEFDLEIPESSMTLKNFRSISTIGRLLSTLQHAA